MLGKGLFLVALLQVASAATPPAPTVLWNVTIRADSDYQLVGNNSVLVVRSRTTLWGRNSATGVELWTATYKPYASAFQELVLVQNASSLIGLDVATGSKLWTTSFAPQIETAVVAWPYFAVATSGSSNATVVAFSATTGQQMWKSTYSTMSVDLTVCGTARLCVGTDQGLTQLDVKTGQELWGPKPDYVFTTSRAFHSTSKGERLAVAEGDYLSIQHVILVDTNTGAPLWNISLGPHTNVVDLLVSDKYVVATYITLDMKRNNAYPSTGVALDINTGIQKFGFGPKGDTMGQTMFLSNGNIVYVGDEAIIQVDGNTGSYVCALTENVQDYNNVRAPGVVDTRFFATYFLMQSSYNVQYLVAMQCD